MTCNVAEFELSAVILWCTI